MVEIAILELLSPRLATTSILKSI